MLQKSTIQLLRFPFSLLLLPVYCFALSQLVYVHWGRALLVFVILHLLVYPASNGYNSYMDRDTGPIGGVAQPLAPTRQLYQVTLLLDALALVLALWVSSLFAAGIFAYILASRAYSYRGIRLKQYPFVGYLTVVLFQGCLTFFLVYHGCSETLKTNAPLSGLLAAGLLIGGFYPLTQIYQHQQDKADGVTTLSYQLGLRGSFIFCAAVYSVALVLLGYTFLAGLQVLQFGIVLLCLQPVLVYFLWWARQVWRNPAAADYRNTMRMNLIAAGCTNLAFIIIVIMNHLE